VDWALHQPIWPGKRATGIHWSPLESTGVHMDYVGEGKDLFSCAISSNTGQMKVSISLGELGPGVARLIFTLHL
jgi:hypothetical protein